MQAMFNYLEYLGHSDVKQALSVTSHSTKQGTASAFQLPENSSWVLGTVEYTQMLELLH